MRHLTTSDESSPLEKTNREVRNSARARKAALARRRNTSPWDLKSSHPTTSDVEYTTEEWEFIRAIQAYKDRTGRKFPTWSEVFRVLADLGYHKDDCGPDG
jgi:hypothetical protein